MAVSGFAVQRVTGSQDACVLTRMTLCRADVSDPAVPMLMVVPMNEARGPAAGLVQASEAFAGELRAVLGGAEQRFNEGVGANSQLRLLGPSSDDFFGLPTRTTRSPVSSSTWSGRS